MFNPLQEKLIQLEGVVIDLQAANTDLEVANIDLQVENTDLKAAKINLEAVNKKLIEENQQLKEKLGLNSTNSSLPPSRDLYKKKKANGIPSTRKAGEQLGHQAHQYQFMQANEVINLSPSKCKCGAGLADIEIGAQCSREQKIEIPPINPHVRDHVRGLGPTKAAKPTHCPSPLPPRHPAHFLTPPIFYFPKADLSCRIFLCFLSISLTSYEGFEKGLL